MPDNNLDIFIRLLIDKIAAEQGEKAVDDFAASLAEFDKQLEKINRQAAATRKISSDLRQMSESIGRVSRGLFVTGGAITGGIFALASKYVKDAKQATDATIAWEKAQKRLSDSSQRIGAVALEAVLPLLEKAAVLAERAADFVERNPDLMRTALNIGMVVTVLGAVGLAVSKGIRLYADVLWLAGIAKQSLAMRSFDASVNKFLVGMAKGIPGLGGAIPGAVTKGATAAGAGGITAIATTVLGVLAAIGGGVVIGGLINDALAKAGVKGFTKTNQFLTGGAYEVGKVIGKVTGTEQGEAERKALVFAAIVGKLTGAIDESSPLWIKANQGINKVNNSLSGLAGTLEGAKLNKALAEWQKDDAQLVQNAIVERGKIIQDARDREMDAERSFRSRSASINRQFANTMQKLTAQYAAGMKEAEEGYVQDRAEIIASGNENIQRMEEENQERMRKLYEDHNARVADLVAARDALGLVKEERRFDQERQEAERGVNEAIARERKETAARLKELDTRFVQERAKRQEQYQADVAEAQAQRSESMAENRRARAEEMRQIREDKKKQLIELDQNLRAERDRRRQQFQATVRDLDTSLMNEREIKQRYYALMIGDTERFMSQFRSATSGLSAASGSAGSGVGTSTASSGSSSFGQVNQQEQDNFLNRFLRVVGLGRAEGGYAEKGIYRLAETGQREFVLSGSTTRAAERALGGTLSQERLLTALSGAGDSRSMQYNDYRRMPSVGPIDRKMLQDDMRATLKQELKHAFSR